MLTNQNNLVELCVNFFDSFPTRMLYFLNLLKLVNEFLDMCYFFSLPYLKVIQTVEFVLLKQFLNLLIDADLLVMRVN